MILRHYRAVFAQLFQQYRHKLSSVSILFKYIINSLPFIQGIILFFEGDILPKMKIILAIFNFD